MLHTTKGMSLPALKEPSPSILDMASAPGYVSARGLFSLPHLTQSFSIDQIVIETVHGSASSTVVLLTHVSKGK